jgi:hypothetical protein
MNTFHHWPDRDANRRELRRAMREDGLLVLVLRMAKPGKGLFAGRESPASWRARDSVFLTGCFETVKISL